MSQTLTDYYSTHRRHRSNYYSGCYTNDGDYDYYDDCDDDSGCDDETSSYSCCCYCSIVDDGYDGFDDDYDDDYLFLMLCYDDDDGCDVDYYDYSLEDGVGDVMLFVVVVGVHLCRLFLVRLVLLAVDVHRVVDSYLHVSSF